MNTAIFAKIGVLTLSGVLLIGLAAREAHADPLHIAAGACVPENEAITDGIYETESTGGWVRFNGTQTGTFKIICPVPYTSSEIDALTLYYGNDGDTTGSNYYIKAALMSRAKSNGVSTEECSVTSNATGFQSKTNNTGCPVLDPDNYFYWVYIELHRTGTTYNPSTYGIYLYNSL